MIRTQRAVNNAIVLANLFEAGTKSLAIALEESGDDSIAKGFGNNMSSKEIYAMIAQRTMTKVKDRR